MRENVRLSRAIESQSILIVTHLRMRVTAFLRTKEVKIDDLDDLCAVFLQFTVSSVDSSADVLYVIFHRPNNWRHKLRRGVVCCSSPPSSSWRCWSCKCGCCDMSCRCCCCCCDWRTIWSLWQRWWQCCAMFPIIIKRNMMMQSTDNRRRSCQHCCRTMPFIGYTRSVRWKPGNVVNRLRTIPISLFRLKARKKAHQQSCYCYCYCY